MLTLNCDTVGKTWSFSRYSEDGPDAQEFGTVYSARSGRKLPQVTSCVTRKTTRLSRRTNALERGCSFCLMNRTLTTEYSLERKSHPGGLRGLNQHVKVQLIKPRGGNARTHPPHHCAVCHAGEPHNDVPAEQKACERGEARTLNKWLKRPLLDAQKKS